MSSITQVQIADLDLNYSSPSLNLPLTWAGDGGESQGYLSAGDLQREFPACACGGQHRSQHRSQHCSSTATPQQTGVLIIKWNQGQWDRVWKPCKTFLSWQKVWSISSGLLPPWKHERNAEWGKHRWGSTGSLCSLCLEAAAPRWAAPGQAARDSSAAQGYSRGNSSSSWTPCARPEDECPAVSQCSSLHQSQARAEPWWHPAIGQWQRPSRSQTREK